MRSDSPTGSEPSKGSTSLGGKSFARTIRIHIKADPAGRTIARGALEDDYHHFRVQIIACDGVIVDATSEGLRGPFTLCGAAGVRLKELVGSRLSSRMSETLRRTSARLQCTHQFDLAALCVSNAARGAERITYEITIPDGADGPTQACLRHDGEEVLKWSIQGELITAPNNFVGQTIGVGFAEWASQSMPPVEEEYALVLRRGAFIARGRHQNRTVSPHASSNKNCWVQQPERNLSAISVPSHKQDFTERREDLTHSDRNWLEFLEAAQTENASGPKIGEP